MKIKVSDKHNSEIAIYSDNNYTEVECERIYNDLLTNGISLYHQANLKDGYRFRLFKLDDLIYLTMALTVPYTDNERVTIYELDGKDEDDALKIVKFFKRNYYSLLKQGKESHDT